MDKIYFKDVKEIGDLIFEYEFFEFEGEPILFLCSSPDKRELYFCLCSECRDEKRWILAKSEISTLEKLIEKKIDILKSYQLSKKIALVTLDKLGVQNSKIISFHEIDLLDLPEKGIYLKCDVNDALSYLKKFKIENNDIVYYAELSIEKNRSYEIKFESKISFEQFESDLDKSRLNNEFKKIDDYSQSNIKLEYRDFMGNQKYNASISVASAA